MHSESTAVSCGILQIYYLQIYKDDGTRYSRLDAFMQTYEDACPTGARPIILFSDNIVYRHGEELASQLREHPRLGRVVETGYVHNDNSGCDINAWMFIRTPEYRSRLLSSWRGLFPEARKLKPDGTPYIVRAIYKEFLEKGA